MSRVIVSQPGYAQTRNPDYLVAFEHSWYRPFCASFRTCPRAAFACFCPSCYAAKLMDRTGEHFCTGCCNPWALMALRTKVRTTFRIRGGLVQDCCLTSCCLAPCALLQIENELDYQGIPNIIGKRAVQ